jgi:hypothetical protein
MPQQNFGTAQSQSVLMLQKVNSMIEKSQNLDKVLQKRFSTVTGDTIGLAAYRQEIQVESGGVTYALQLDGGNYAQGTGAQYVQAIIAPVSIGHTISATKLAMMISKGGPKDVVVDYVARLIKDVKEKVAHKQNIYLQTYNDGKLATVDSTWGGVSTLIPLAKGEFGGRLIDLGDVLQVDDGAGNMVGEVQIQEVNKNSINGIDTVTIDQVPVGMVSTSNFYVKNVATGNPLFVAGLKYLVDYSNTGDYFGLDRAMPYVQSPALNANGAFFTIGGTLGFLERMEQALGSERFQSEGGGKFFYTHGANYVSQQMQGFGKQVVLLRDGKAAGNYDGLPNIHAPRQAAGMELVTDSVAAIDKVYWLDQSVLNCVRYPGSQAFIPGMVEGGLWWPRMVNGQWNSQYDATYQDSANFFIRNLWACGVMYGLGTQPLFSA